MVIVSQDQGAETLEEAKRRVEEEKRASAMAHPLVQAALETFPDAQLVARRDKSPHNRQVLDGDDDQSAEQ